MQGQAKLLKDEDDKEKLLAAARLLSKATADLLSAAKVLIF